MGIDYYNCAECKQIYADCGDYKTCCVCRDGFCGWCLGVQSVPLKCDGNCTKSTGYTVGEGSEKEEGCVCADKVKMLYKEGYCHCDTSEEEENPRHLICNKCLYIEDPYKVDDTELMEFLVEHTEFSSVEEAREDCRKLKIKYKQ